MTIDVEAVEEESDTTADSLSVSSETALLVSLISSPTASLLSSGATTTEPALSDMVKFFTETVTSPAAGAPQLVLT